MARFYTEISKEEFLNKVQKIMENEEYPYEMPKHLLKDLGKVNFDFENWTSFDEDGGFGNYPVGYQEIAPNFHVFFANAGGDWEYPICWIFYWGDKKMRAYIPEDGNAWNKKEKCAYGSDENPKEDNESYDKEVSEEKMIAEILQHITKK